MYMKNLLSVFNNPDSLAHPPVWMMRQAGRYLPEYRAVRSQYEDFLTLCQTPEAAKEVTLQPLRRFDLSAAIIFSDILMIPMALGQKVWFVEGEGPRLEPLRTWSSVNEADYALKLMAVYESIEMVRSALAPSQDLIGFCGAPWTLLTYMVSGQRTRESDTMVIAWLLEDEVRCQDAFNGLVEACVRHLCGQVEAGCDVVQIFDSWAGTLPDSHIQPWCIEPTRRIVEGVKSVHPHVPVIAFPKGLRTSLLSYVENTNVDGISVDHSRTIGGVFDELGGSRRVVVQGNLNPGLLREGGSAMMSEVDRILQNAESAFIFNLSHGIIKDTPPEHVSMVVDRVKKGTWSGAL